MRMKTCLSSSRATLGFSFAGKYSGENRVYVAQLALEVKGLLDHLCWYPSCDLPVLQDLFAKVQPLFPGAHGVTLHKPVSILAGYAVLYKIKQQLPAEHQPSRAFQVCFHPLWIDEHCVQEVRCLLRHVIDQGGRVWQDDPFHRRM